MGKLKFKHSEVLRYQEGRRSQATVRRHYIAWRNEQTPSIPLRCDNPKCTFYSNLLTWNGAELKLILDHKDGVCGNNRTENLQFLCPNCNSQQSTHGGGNKGRVEQSEGGYSIKRKDGKKDYTLPVESGFYSINTK